jgi:hypothetical protein
MGRAVGDKVQVVGAVDFVSSRKRRWRFLANASKRETVNGA